MQMIFKEYHQNSPHYSVIISFTIFQVSHLFSMKYNNVGILYDKNDYVTQKLAKDLISVLILPNAQVLVSCSE